MASLCACALSVTSLTLRDQYNAHLVWTVSVLPCQRFIRADSVAHDHWCSTATMLTSLYSCHY